MLVTETGHKILQIYDATYMKCPEFGKSTETEGRLLIVWSRKKGWIGDHS